MFLNVWLLFLMLFLFWFWGELGWWFTVAFFTVCVGFFVVGGCGWGGFGLFFWGGFLWFMGEMTDTLTTTVAWVRIVINLIHIISPFICNHHLSFIIGISHQISKLHQPLPNLSPSFHFLFSLVKHILIDISFNNGSFADFLQINNGFQYLKWLSSFPRSIIFSYIPFCLLSTFTSLITCIFITLFLFESLLFLFE